VHPGCTVAAQLVQPPFNHSSFNQLINQEENSDAERVGNTKPRHIQEAPAGGPIIRYAL
jgi:hypothetical protein